MSNRLALLPIGLFVLWCVLCQQWYVCHIKQKCDEKPAVATPATPVDNRPIVFAWNSDEPETRPSYEAYRDSVLAAMQSGKLLEVTGWYSKDETPPPGFANMGLARAAKIKARLLAEISSLKAEQIVENSRLIDEPQGARTGKFLASSFGFRDKPTNDQVEIVELDNTITILFPYGQSVKETDPRVDEYLDKLADRLKKTDETVSITGHTDGSGTPDFNKRLGLQRAKYVRDLLVDKGVKRNRITADSKGESDPAASNETEEGARQNRRVVLVLNKKTES